MTSLVGYFVGQIIGNAWREDSVPQPRELPLEVVWYFSPSTGHDLLVVGDSHSYEQRLDWLGQHEDAMVIDYVQRERQWRS